jgi:hypothetical protein
LIYNSIPGYKWICQTMHTNEIFPGIDYSISCEKPYDHNKIWWMLNSW